MEAFKRLPKGIRIGCMGVTGIGVFLAACLMFGMLLPHNDADITPTVASKLVAIDVPTQAPSATTVSTDTPVPPTATPVPATSTSMPPVAIPILPTDTLAPPTDTAIPPTTTSVPVSAKVSIDPSCCQFDSPGNDNDTLEQEYVCFINRGDAPVTMTRWYFLDRVDTRYSFPSGFILAQGATVRVRTGHGENTATDLYWNRGQAVWNNEHDTLRLYDAAGTMMDSYAY